MITKVPLYRRNYQRDERTWFAATATVKETNKRASSLKY